MFVAIYLFEVDLKKTDQFVNAWKELTSLIYQYEGSLGSRLHKKTDTTYIAYAQWPDKLTWKSAGNKLPEKANEVRKIMKDACKSIETLHEIEVVSDLLK